MQSQAAARCMSRDVLSDMISRLKKDFGIVSGEQAVSDIVFERDLDPLAVDYLVAGSRLGSKVLRKRWASSNDPTVRRAHHYFGQVGDLALWRTTCQALSDVPVDSSHAKIIIDDTKALFQLFVTAFVGVVSDRDALV